MHRPAQEEWVAHCNAVVERTLRASVPGALRRSHGSGLSRLRAHKVVSVEQCDLERLDNRYGVQLHAARVLPQLRRPALG